MKNKTMKKALSLILAVLLVALALPFTIPAMAEEGAATTIKYAKMFARYTDDWNVHAVYGSVAGMIDGDTVDSSRSKNHSYPYFYSDPISAPNTTFCGKEYFGYAMFELNAKSKLDDITIWLASDGTNDTSAATWSDPTKNWTMNDAYDIYVSEDGVNWTLKGEFTNMSGDGTNKGANFPSEGDAAYASRTMEGYLRVGHKIALAQAEAKYVAVAVSGCTKEQGTNIVIGEVTVNGTTVEAVPTVKTPAQIYAEANDGEVIKAVNFNDMDWSDDYVNADNWNSYYMVSEDGTTVRHEVHTTKQFAANNKRSMWGGFAEKDSFSLDDGSKYTIYFDAEFGSTSANIATIGVQVDGNNTLLIDGYGYSYWYAWNTKNVDKSDGNDGYDKWNYNTNRAKSDKQSFAVEVDPVNEEMTLFIADKDGTYNKVRTLTYTDADISGSLVCKIYTRTSAGSGGPWVEVSDLRICKGIGYAGNKLVTGAAVRMDDPTGLRFTGRVNKAYVDGLKTQYGTDNVDLGMLITPTDYLTNNGLNFTKADLDACTAITGAKYLEIDAETILTEGDEYVINCAIVNVLEGNYDRAFSAILYVKVNNGTTTTYTYYAYSEANNSRSIAEVSEAAYYDLADAQDTTYAYAVTVDGATKYSPYTEAQRTTLYGFFN